MSVAVMRWKGLPRRFFDNPQTLNFVVIFACSIFASLMFSGHVEKLGSLIVVCYALPAAKLLANGPSPSQNHHWKALWAGLAINLIAIAMEPGWLNLTTGWFLLTAIAIAQRENDVPAMQRLGTAFLRSIFSAPVVMGADAAFASRKQPLASRHMLAIPITSLFLPAVTGLIFAVLLSMANPMIEQFVFELRFSNMFDLVWDFIFSTHMIIFVLALITLWPILRGRTSAAPEVALSEATAPLWHRVFFKPLAVILTLLLLNTMFAVENILDLQHVWWTGALPQGVGHAEYVHRGAYTLIATAILAGLLMVFALRQGTATAQSGLVRRLVYLWTVQNLMLVASSARRTMSYIDAFGWTEWRLAGLLWMALVFFGLASIAWRVLQNRDARWLINTNLLATLVLLLITGLWNSTGFIAERNVDRGIAGKALDTRYIEDLGPNVLPALRRLQDHHRANEVASHKPSEAAISHRKVEAIAGYMRNIEDQTQWLQRHWNNWTLRTAFIMSPS